ncbi:MAG: hypothetical protein ABR567_08670 [Myxococcales bacterium]
MPPTGFDAEPDHPVLPMPGYYEVIRLDWHVKSEDEPFLDMWVVREGQSAVVQLRFWSPQQLGIDTGFNGFNSGFRIKDISRRGMEVQVAVTSFEQDPAVHFLATRVERVG